MAAISGTLVAAGGSAIFTPTNGVSDVVITRRAGEVQLFAIPPVGDPQNVSSETGAYDVLTPDIAITYQFVATGADVDIDYYMGP